MHPPSLTADILAGVIAVVIPLTGPLERRLYRSWPDTRTKLLAYAGLCILLWTLAAAAVRVGGGSALLANPAAGELWRSSPTIWSVTAAIAVMAYAVIGLMPLIQSLRGPRWRSAYASAVRRAFHEIPGFLPQTATERAAWVLVSLSAGICEEIIFRGFLLRHFAQLGGGMPTVAALVASSLIFGLAHVYQGAKGVAGSTVGGLVLGLLFLVSGSLLACIVLHGLLDIQLVYVLRPVADDVVAGG